MAFNRPSLKDLITRTTADLVSRLELVGVVLRRAFVRELAKVWAGLVHSVHGHLEYLSRQILVNTADGAGLDAHGADYKLPRKAATFAAGEYTFTGTNGTNIPAGTVVQRSDGSEYTVDANAAIAGGTATADVTAVVAGDAGNADAGVVMNLAQPIVGVDSSGTVAAGGLTGGTDTESDDDYRARIIERKSNTPQGGAAHDYVQWAQEIAGVTRVWVYPLEDGPGTVTVRFVRDNDSGSIIPDAGEVTAVQDHIDDLKPVTADVTVEAPTAVALNFTIEITPDTTEVRAAVEASLRDMILRDSEPGGTILLSHIREAISVAAGEHDYALTAPVANVTHTTSQLCVFGAITWV
jgi:uncharacterized phage protein gp47/JayE